VKTIPLTKGYLALVDDEDYERVTLFKWCAHVKPGKNFHRVYAVRSIRVDGKKTFIYMHRFVLRHDGPVDHKDNNGINNQKHNIRPTTVGQNATNRRQVSSRRFRGVRFIESGQTYRAEIKVDGVSHQIGNFKTEEDAATAYNFRAFELVGDFARFNVVQGA